MCLLALLTCCSLGIGRIGSALDLWFNSFVPTFWNSHRLMAKLLPVVQRMPDAPVGSSHAPWAQHGWAMGDRSYLGKVMLLLPNGQVYWVFKNILTKLCLFTMKISRKEMGYLWGHSPAWDPPGVTLGSQPAVSPWCAPACPGRCQGWSVEQQQWVPLVQEVGVDRKEMLSWAEAQDTDLL